VAEAELESARQKLFEAEEHARDEWRATRVDPAIIETLRLQDARDEELLRQVSVGRHALPDDVVPPRLQARLRERKAQLQATIQGGVNGQGDD
jgi:hypothetical protein